MAGTLKPNIADIKESSYTVLNSDLYNFPTATSTTPRVFDQLINGDSNFSQFSSDGKFLEIELHVDSIIWALPMVGSSYVNDNIDILKWDGKSYVDTGENLIDSPSSTNSDWFKTTGVLPKGRYKFIRKSGAKTWRTDKEWFIQKSETINKTLILHDGKYKRYIEDLEEYMIKDESFTDGVLLRLSIGKETKKMEVIE